MGQVTTWHADTCQCVVSYTSDALKLLSEYKHRCPYHSTFATEDLALAEMHSAHEAKARISRTRRGIERLLFIQR
jgi:hypothetical protein